MLFRSTPKDGWKSSGIKTLEDDGVIRLFRGNVISKIDIEENNGDYPIYSSSVVNDGLMGKYGKYMFNEELITWSIDGGGDFFYRKKHKYSVTNVCGYMKVDKSKCNIKFLSYMLQNEHAKMFFDYLVKAHPSVIRTLYKFTLPKLDEQNKIANALSAVDKHIDLEKKKLDKLKEQRKSLMQLLLTGIVRV